MKFEPKVSGQEPQVRLRGGADPGESSGCWSDIRECFKGDQGKYKGSMTAAIMNPNPEPQGFTLPLAG